MCCWVECPGDLSKHEGLLTHFEFAELHKDRENVHALLQCACKSKCMGSLDIHKSPDLDQQHDNSQGETWK
jgi:hypothetical protein